MRKTRRNYESFLLPIYLLDFRNGKYKNGLLSLLVARKMLMTDDKDGLCQLLFDKVAKARPVDGPHRAEI